MDMIVIENFLIFLIGAGGYGCIELLWRGRTHWTMLLLGGICFLILYRIVTRLNISLLKKWLLSAVFITMLEFYCGCLVNLRLGWAVWDYSDAQWNLLGQICPQFFGLWFLLSIPCSGLARVLQKLFIRCKVK